MKILKFLPQLFFPTLIILVVGFLAWKNYVPGTWLMGWDSLHPELNFPLAFQRAIFGAWRSDQGVGAIAAHAVSADLPHIFLLWVSSFILKQELLRYFYIFLCLLTGPLGIYFFLRELFSQPSPRLWRASKSEFVIASASFLGAIYYLLNLATLQNFYLPFEMFNTQFALLPWLFLFVTQILKEGKRKNYLVFGLISLLAAPMAYAPALFYSYLGSLAIFLLLFWILSKFKFQILKRAFIIGLLVFLSNAFWILPNLYSIKNQSQTISQSKINTLFSPEAFLRNEDYGTVSNTLIHKNFLFTWRAFDFSSNQFVDLFKGWSDYLAEPHILQIGYGLALVSLLGMLVAFIKKDKFGISIFGVTVLALFFLINVNYQTGFLYKYLYDHFGIFREAFRMPFTKFSILFEFVMAVYFGYFFFGLFSLLSKNKIIKLLSPLITIVVVSGLVVFMLPAFKGDLISNVVKNKLPQEYFDAYKFLNGRQGRIAKLPMQTLYNWEQHSWKYEGSAWFSWFLSANPQLDRDFDRWSGANESFYSEASFALYQKDANAFKKVLQKYEVKYLLLDESIINAGGSPDSLFIPETKALFADEGFKSVANYGFLTIYDTGFQGGAYPVKALNSYIEVGSDLTYSHIDPIYSQYQDYTQTVSGKVFPFINLDKRSDVKVKIKDEKLVFENAKADANVSLSTKDKVSEDFSKKRGFALGYNCDLAKIGNVDKQYQGNGNLYSASEGGVSCDFFDYPSLKYDQGYVLRVKGENRIGRGLKIYLYNYSTKKMDLEELLPVGEFDKYFVILPKTVNGSQSTVGGYSLNIETRSFGRIASENILNGIEFYPFDYNLLKNVYKGPIAPNLLNNNLKVSSVKNFGNSYLVETDGSGLLTLGQGYDEGWQAFELNNESRIMNNAGKLFPWFFGQKLEHVKVNSWENGWKISENGDHKILIIFWPQYLEWAGFVLFGLTFATIVFSKIKSRNGKN